MHTLVNREQPSFQAPFEGHIVLLWTKVIRHRVPDCRTLHSECSASNSREPVPWHHHQLLCGSCYGRLIELGPVAPSWFSAELDQVGCRELVCGDCALHHF